MITAPARSGLSLRLGALARNQFGLKKDHAKPARRAADGTL
jgi:hypothetical protein